ncbi:hypothetical protein P7C70_g4994, partial [Phenoliferia sp. Uapishka_3]
MRFNQFTSFTTLAFVASTLAVPVPAVERALVSIGDIDPAISLDLLKDLCAGIADCNPVNVVNDKRDLVSIGDIDPKISLELLEDLCAGIADCNPVDVYNAKRGLISIGDIDPSISLDLLEDPCIVDFSSLPHEIKAAILDRVGWQEEAWRVRRKGGGARGEEEQDQKEEMVHVNGVVAASLVSKEWRTLIGKHLFRVLTSYSANLPRFRHLVYFEHRHEFSQVRLWDTDLDGAHQNDYNGLDHTLSILPSLVNLRSLDLESSAAKLLFGLDLNFCLDLKRGEAKAMAVATLHKIVRQVSDLTLRMFTPLDAAKVLAIWPNVHRLHITQLDSTATGRDDGNVLAATLSGKRHLRYLLWDDFDSLHGPVFWKLDTVNKLRTDPPPVLSLALTATALNASDFNFITIFSSTLRHLEVDLPSFHPIPAAITVEAILPLDLPNLVSLSLNISANLENDDYTSVSLTLLKLLSASPLASPRNQRWNWRTLRSFSLTCSSLFDIYDAEAIYRMLDGYPDGSPDGWQYQVFCLEGATGGEFGWEPFFFFLSDNVYADYYEVDGDVSDCDSDDSEYEGAPVSRRNVHVEVVMVNLEMVRSGPTSDYYPLAFTDYDVWVDCEHEVDWGHYDWEQMNFKTLAGHLYQPTADTLRDRFTCPDCSNNRVLTCGKKRTRELYCISLKEEIQAELMAELEEDEGSESSDEVEDSGDSEHSVES